jgi:hypothetical protein
MIASLTGRLRRKTTDYLVLDVSGVGYRVQTPLSTYYGIPEAGEEITLHIHTHVREDSLALWFSFGGGKRHVSASHGSFRASAPGSRSPFCQVCVSDIALPFSPRTN